MVKQATEFTSSTWFKAVLNPVKALRYARILLVLRKNSFNENQLLNILEEISGVKRDKLDTVYGEATTDVMKRYKQQFKSFVSPVSPANIYFNTVGAEKYARFDRISLYCLVRVLKPDIVLETGVMWGESSFFITEALKRNGSGKLYSIDIGVDGPGANYPSNIEEVGFFVPNDNYDWWELHIGDSITVMNDLLPTLENVDIFYHDSKHAYEHMMSEFNTIFPYMSVDGLLMSEDIDENEAWEQFVKDHSEDVYDETRYYSMHSIDNTNREIGVIRTKLNQ